jgi:hypothetical protein
MIALVGCGGDDGNNNNDAAVDGRPVLTLDCATYCTTIQANCTGANAQYPTETDNAHCLGTCMKFTVGTSADMGGQNTLGCRLYHAQNAMISGDPATHCPHAGPGGAAISTAATQPAVCGDACTSFCTLEIAVCGTTGANAQYTSMADCMTACGTGTTGFNKSKPYVVGPPQSSGDSLACRLYHATNAATSAANATAHCPHTRLAGGMNAATCMMGTPPAP